MGEAWERREIGCEAPGCGACAHGEARRSTRRRRGGEALRLLAQNQADPRHSEDAGAARRGVVSAWAPSPSAVLRCLPGREGRAPARGGRLTDDERRAGVSARAARGAEGQNEVLRGADARPKAGDRRASRRAGAKYGGEIARGEGGLRRILTFFCISRSTYCWHRARLLAGRRRPPPMSRTPWSGRPSGPRGPTATARWPPRQACRSAG